MPNRSVLISGVGIAGPTLAYWLAEHGFQPTLVEQAPRLRTSGYIIDFWGLGYDIAERMGLLPELERTGYRVEELRLVNDRGRRVGGFSVDVVRRLTGGRYITLQRGDLAALLYRTIEGRCETIFGDGITVLKQTGDGVSVTFERAPTRSFDLVIGADGLHSAVRGAAFGNAASVEAYLGYVVAAFEIGNYRPRDERAYVSYGLPGKQASRFAMRDDRTLVLFVFASAQRPEVDHHDIRAQKRILHREFGSAGWECPQMLAALDDCEDFYFDRVSQIRMDRWSHDRVALVGDAAFCPSLLAGQGAALAMIAAYVLAGELAAANGDHRRAFECYQQVLHSFIAGKQTAAEKFAASFAPKTRFGLFVRNQISRLFGLPLVAEMVFGRDLIDRLTLPDYPPGQSRPMPPTAARKASPAR